MKKSVLEELFSFRCVLFVVLTVLLFQSVNASIITGNITPSTVLICGDFASSQTLTAINVTNTGSENLTNLSISLVLPSESGLSITTNPIIVENLAVNQIILTNPSWSVSCSPGNKGNYTAYITYSQNNTTISTTQGTKEFLIKVSPELLKVTSSNPSGITNIPKLNATTNTKAICKYDKTDKPFNDMSNEFSTTNSLNHLQNLVLTDGVYTYFIRCKDESGSQITSSERIDFILDTKAPQVLSYTPQGFVKSRFTSLNLSVDEESVCTYEDKSNYGLTGNLKRLSSNTQILNTVMNTEEKNPKLFYGIST